MSRATTSLLGAILGALAPVVLVACVDLRKPPGVSCADACPPTDDGGPPPDAAAPDAPVVPPDGARDDGPPDGPEPPDSASHPDAEPPDVAGPETPEAPPPPPPDTGPEAPVPADFAPYNFEQDVHGWRLIRPSGNATTAARATTRAFAGASALAIDLDGPAGAVAVAVGCSGAAVIPPPAGGANVAFRIWFPVGTPLQSVSPYFIDLEPTLSRAYTTSTAASSLVAGAWNTIIVTTPATLTNVIELGIEWRTTAAWRGTVHVDAVAW